MACNNNHSTGLRASSAMSMAARLWSPSHLARNIKHSYEQPGNEGVR